MKTEEQWDVIFINPDGTETAGTMTWIRETESCRRTDGTEYERESCYPSGFISLPTDVGDSEAFASRVWESKSDGDTRYVVGVSPFGNYETRYVCPSLRVAMSILGEFTPHLEYMYRWDILTQVNDHLSAYWERSRGRFQCHCYLCQLLDAIRGR